MTSGSLAGLSRRASQGAEKENDHKEKGNQTIV
jgi:hypothetical protein